MSDMHIIPPDYIPLAEAYLRMLKTPMGSVARTELQGVMSEMRDILAQATGASAEYVQDYCERAAAGRDYILSERDPHTIDKAMARRAT